MTKDHDTDRPSVTISDDGRITFNVPDAWAKTPQDASQESDEPCPLGALCPRTLYRPLAATTDALLTS